MVWIGYCSVCPWNSEYNHRLYTGYMVLWSLTEGGGKIKSSMVNITEKKKKGLHQTDLRA